MDNSITDKNTNSPKNNTTNNNNNNNKNEETKNANVALPAANLSNQVVSANGMINSVSSLASASASSSSSSSALVIASTSNNTPPSTTMLSIKVHIIDLNLTKTLQFNPTTLVFDALKIIREKVPETNTETGKLLLIFLNFMFFISFFFFIILFYNEINKIKERFDSVLFLIYYIFNKKKKLQNL